jgi:hypothetical protein
MGRPKAGGAAKGGAVIRERPRDDESRLEAIEAQIEQRQCELDDQWLKAWLDEMERAHRGQTWGE